FPQWSSPADRTGAGFGNVARRQITPPLTQRLDSVAKRIGAYQQQGQAASARLGSSVQEYVCRADDFDRAVVQDETERSVVTEPAKAAADRLILADMHGQAGARQMRPLLPGADQRRAFARPPQ